jgi:hypothetical protein
MTLCSFGEVPAAQFEGIPQDLSLFLYSLFEERSAGNLFATFHGGRGRVTAPGD